MTSNIIRDGYTRRGYIAAADRLHDSLAFEYRPMLAEEVEALDDAIRTKPAKQSVLITAAAIAGKLVSWSESEPVSVDAVRRLHYAVFTKLHRIVAGLMACDPLPDSKPDGEDDYLVQLMETTPGLAELRDDEKNSVKG